MIITVRFPQHEEKIASKDSISLSPTPLRKSGTASEEKTMGGITSNCFNTSSTTMGSPPASLQNPSPESVLRQSSEPESAYIHFPPFEQAHRRDATNALLNTHCTRSTCNKHNWITKAAWSVGQSTEFATPEPESPESRTSFCVVESPKNGAVTAKVTADSGTIPGKKWWLGVGRLVSDGWGSNSSGSS